MGRGFGRAIVSEQIASGQSVAAFCKERGVTSAQVFAWKKRLREAEKAQFMEVQVKPGEPLRRLGFGSKSRRLKSGSVEVAASRSTGFRCRSFACIAVGGRPSMGKTVLMIEATSSSGLRSSSRTWAGTPQGGGPEAPR